MQRGIIALFFICLCLPALAGPTMSLRLVDGSVITGEMLSYGGGIYRIRSETLGLLEIPDEQVETLLPSGAENRATPAPQASQGAEVLQLQQRIAGDASLMGLIMQLQSDPDMQAVLADPAILQAIASNDLESLQNNPKILQLMEHPVIQQIFQAVR